MNKIESYIKTEFNHIRSGIKIHFENESDINELKEYLAINIPKEIDFRSNALLETLINLKMSDAIDDIKKYDISVQKFFFEIDFRAKMKSIIQQSKYRLALKPEVILLQKDPRIVNGVFVGGITFITGAVITIELFNLSNLIVAIISGIVTLVLTFFLYEVAYNKSTEHAKRKLQKDIMEYLSEVELQVIEWLNGIDELFNTEFKQFCKQHQLN